MQMKTLRYIFLMIAILPFAGCDTNDDGFYNETYVDIPNLVQIDVQPTYTAGDYLYVSASLSRYLNEPGEDLPLDIYTTTNGAEAFDFSYVLEKKVGDEWQPVEIANAMLDVAAGSVYEITPTIFASATYDPEIEMYKSTVGIPLETTGQFRLYFASADDSPKKAELRSQSERNDLSLNISSTVSQLDANGFYIFTVN